MSTGLALVLALGSAPAAAGAEPSAPEPTPAARQGGAPTPDAEPQSAAPPGADTSGLPPQAPDAEPLAPPDPDAEFVDFEEGDLLAEEEDALGPGDPLEPVNRSVFRANRFVDCILFDPLARGYGWLVPEPGKRAVARVFDNLNAPVVFVNDLLQLAPRRAGRTGARFLLNTTLGVAGIFDVAERLGIDGHVSDFGQTLGRSGVGAGPYLVLPLLGPSTVRDALGQLVDAALRPDTWLLSPGGRLVLATTGGVSRREAYLLELDELERSSVDFYATLRGVYLMSREAAIREDED